jgi:hypothetical protein
LPAPAAAAAALVAGIDVAAELGETEVALVRLLVMGVNESLLLLSDVFEGFDDEFFGMDAAGAREFEPAGEETIGAGFPGSTPT